LLFLVLAKLAFAQHALDYFIDQAVKHSPALNEHRNLQASNQIQSRLNRAQHSAFQLSITGDYLFTPYFNNHGDLITTNPSPEAIGYDIGLFNGGLYSAQVNLEHSLFNGRLMNALNQQVQIQGENYQYGFTLELHNLNKEVTAQYLHVLQFSRHIRLSQEVTADLEQQLKLTGEMVKQGYARTQDYLLLQIELKSQLMSLRDVKQQYKSNLLQLYALCGMQDTALVNIDSLALRPASSKIASNFTRRYELDSLAAATGQTLFETKYQPQLQFFFNTGLNAVQLQDIQRKFGMSAGLNFSLALFDGNQKGLSRQQVFTTYQTISEYRQFSERGIALQRHNLLSQLEALQENLETLSGQIEDYKHLIDISAKQLQQGNVSMIDYLILLRNSTELRKSKIEMEITYQLAINNYNYWTW